MQFLSFSFHSHTLRMKEDHGDAAVIVTHLVETKPVESLALLARDIALCKPPEWPHRSAISALVSIAARLAPIFDHVKSSLSPCVDGREALSITAAVCIKEVFVVLKWARSLIELCSTGSRIAALLLADAHSHEFRTLVGELTEVLGLFPWRSLGFVEDVKSREVEMNRIKEECEKMNEFVEQKDLDLREKIVAEIEEIVKDFFPDREEARRLFNRIGVIGFEAQVKEIKLLEQELASCYDRAGAAAKAAGELVRYSKFVIFGEAWPDPRTYERCPREDWVFPPAVKCPVTGAVMRDPVLLSTGAVYDRANIQRWLNAGNKSCPVTGEVIDGSGEAEMTPVPAVRELIDDWCKKAGVKLRVTQKITKQMRAAYLVEMLGRTNTSALAQAACRVVQEISSISEGSTEWREIIGEEMPFEVLLQQVERQGDEERREMAMRAVGILAQKRSNLKRIAAVDNGLGLILAAVGQGQPWGLRGEAAVVVYWLSTVSEYRSRMLAAGEERAVVRDLQEVMRDGPALAQKGAMAGIIGVGSHNEKEVEVRFLLNRWVHGEKEAVAGLVVQEPVRSLVQKMGQKWWTKLGREAGRLLDVCTSWKDMRPAKPRPDYPSSKIVPVDDDANGETTLDSN